jgi:N4-gp56 family major capsid protein
MVNVYGDGTNSTIGTQFNTYEYKRKALIETAKVEYFGQLGDTESLTKNYGQKIKKYHYLPLLDDRNINDQGLDATGAVISNGNLYGSSKDPGVVSGKLPTLSETGGRVNRVGFKRVEIEGEIAQYGFFYEWSEDSLNFDTDMDLYSHINRESLRGAREISEDIAQMDLLDAAGVVKFIGASAVSIATVSDIVKYNDLIKLGVTLDDNRCPKDTKAIKGSQDIDIINIPAARYAFIGSELIPTFMRMTDYHGDRAFVPVEKYAKMENGKYTNTLHGEIGAVGPFRLVVVPEMMGYKGQGIAVGSAVDGSTLLGNGTKVDVYPILVIGSGSFAKINFQSSGTTNDKFKVIVRKPGTFANPEDPFEKIGYSSIQFWQGTMILRPEWIAKVLTAAKA